MSKDADIDWSLTTWEGVRREQLRRNLRLTVAERLRALDDLATLSRHLADIGGRRLEPGSASSANSSED